MFILTPEPDRLPDPDFDLFIDLADYKYSVTSYQNSVDIYIAITSDCPIPPDAWHQAMGWKKLASFDDSGIIYWLLVQIDYGSTGEIYLYLTGPFYEHRDHHII